MKQATLDYEASKTAYANLEAKVEQLEQTIKNARTTGEDLIAGNNSPGVKSTMDASMEQMEALVKVGRQALDEMGKVVGMAQEMHASQGGDL